MVPMSNRTEQDPIGRGAVLAFVELVDENTITAAQAALALLALGYASGLTVERVEQYVTDAVEAAGHRDRLLASTDALWSYVDAELLARVRTPQGLRTVADNCADQYDAEYEQIVATLAAVALAVAS